MKIKFLASLLLLTVIFTGCKKEKSLDDLPVVDNASVDTSFKVTLRLTATKEDDYALYYTEDGSTDFKSAPIWNSGKGTTSEQDIEFTLPDGVYPTNLRLDFGIRKIQEVFDIKSITIQYKGKDQVFAGADIAKFFRANEGLCTLDPSSGMLKAKMNGGKSESPSLYPLETLSPELVKFAK